MPKEFRLTPAVSVGFTAIAAFVVYRLTLAPDLTWANWGQDGGELITAVSTLGIPHPPGYPTYVAVGQLFRWLPLQPIAVRFNLFSAASTAVAASFLAATAHTRQRQYPVSALVIGLLFAFAPLVWSQAIITEVYGLNLAFVAAFLWHLQGKRPSFPTGLLLGLSITTHLSSLLLLPLALLETERNQWPRLAAGMLLGLTPFLLLPLLAQNDSPVVWGDPTTLSGWWWLVSGRLYHDNLLAVSATELAGRLRDWGPRLLSQFTWAGLPLLLYGIIKIERQHLFGQLAYLVTAVLYLIYAFTYAPQDALVLTLPALLILSLFLEPGLQKLGRIALILPLLSVLLHFNSLDLSNERPVRPLATELLTSLPANALVLTPGDQTIFALWYFQHVEERRSDVILVDANLFAIDWYRQRLHQLHPSLLGWEQDDLTRFQQLNQSRRPFCRASLAYSPHPDCEPGSKP